MNVPQLRFDGFDGEWEEVKLGDIAESLSYGMNASAKPYDGENRYVRITDIDEDSRRYIENGKVSPNGNLTSDYLVQEGDILFARTGASTGKSYMYRTDEGKMYYAGFLIRARIKEEFDYRFIYFQTLRGKYDKWVKVMSMRSGQPGINAAEYAGFEFNLPSIDEQKKIADFLMLIDKKIEKQQEKIEKLERFKRGMMQKIFSQELRFKDEDGEEFPEWEEKQLREFATKIVRKNTDMKITNVISNSAKQGLISQRNYFKKDIANELNINGYYVISKGDFVYNPRISSESPYGPVHVYELEADGIVSPLYLCFKTKNIDSKFLKYFFMSSQWYKHIYTYGDSGARHDRVSIKDSAFFEMNMAIPSMDEQKKISEYLDALNLKFEKEKEKLMVLEEQKRGFMQGMFV